MRRLTAKAEDETFRAVLAAHAPAVTAFALRRWPNDADDLVAQALVIGWQRWNDDPASLTTGYLIGVVKNLARNLNRAHQREMVLAAQVATGLAHDHDPADAVGTRSAVLDALATLSEDDRLILTLVAWDDVSPTVLAEVLGTSVATARVRLHRARRRLDAAYGKDEQRKEGPL